MRRFHLFEFEDQTWFPAIIRDAGTTYLEFVGTRAGHTAVLTPLLSRALEKSGEHRIVDLCSGGSGPLSAALTALPDCGGRPVEATLTDLYPNREAFDRAEHGNPAIRGIVESIDATNVPAELVGLRTLFSAFHHFRPSTARGILRDAFESRRPIAVFEFVARSPYAMFGMLFAPIIALFVLPFLRPFRWSWIPLTYVVPVIPLFILWDGMVSCLRCYTQEELREMTAELGSKDYEWEIGPIDMPGAPFDGCYLIGSPLHTRAS